MKLKKLQLENLLHKFQQQRIRVDLLYMYKYFMHDKIYKKYNQGREEVRMENQF